LTVHRAAVTVAAAALILSACGSGKSVATNSAAQAGIGTAERVVKRCVPNPLVLASTSARNSAIACAVSPGKEKQAATCLEKGVLSGIPTKARIENVLIACVQKAEG
jgi:hypothetical protein